MSSLLNLGSMLLGLTAWIVPFLAMKQYEKDGVKTFRCIVISFSACIAALCLQFFEINHRVQIQDWSAIMDTIGALKWVALILAVITIILNIMVLGICHEEKTKTQ